MPRIFTFVNFLITFKLIIFPKELCTVKFR